MKNNIYFVLVIFFSFSLVIVISTMSSLNDIPTLSVNNLKVKSDNHYLDVIIDDNRSYISKNPEIYKKIYSMLENNNNKNFLKSYELFTHYNDDDDMIKKINVNTLINTCENDI